MRPSEPSPQLSSSLPATPMEHPAQTPPLDRAVSAPDVNNDPFGPPLEEQANRPPSRPRVGFSDNVEIIPRPLSTISSETESSISTLHGHSVNNSISSMLSLGSPSPPSNRSRNPLSAPLEGEPKPRAKSSVEISRRVEKEGEWLKSRSSNSLKRPLSESAAAPPKTTFAEPEHPARKPSAHKKRQSLSHAFGLDRRRSEPTIGMAGNEESRSSAISLGSLSSVSDATAVSLEPTSSSKRLRAWASAKISKKPRESQRAISETSSRSSMRPESAGSGFVPGKVTPAPDATAAETNLDAVFSSTSPKPGQEPSASPPQPRIEVSSASPVDSSPKRSWRDDDDDDGAMLDLDAALGPFKTPPMGGAQRQRKELHSSRLTRDFTGPGGHYHRRAESAPALPPFEYSPRVSTPSQSSMADVFEEEEEDDLEDTVAIPALKAASTSSVSEEESGIGISVVDSANSGSSGLWNLGVEDGLGIQRGEWEPERPSTSYGNAASRLSTAGTDRRGSSLMEETIFEEASPVEAPAPSGIEIVDSEEEPRASSLTKSSDSSETPTLLGPAATLLPAVDDSHNMTTPDTYQTSTFSSPDFSRRQSSFDASRLNTAASSIADTRTTSSCATGEQGSEVRMSVDDVPSLTSSRSTMLSTAQANHSQRNISEERTPSAVSNSAAIAAERRSKRGSIASLSQLLSSRSKDHDELRPKTAADPTSTVAPAKKKEHRLKKLMFWKAKHGGHSKSATRSQP